MAYQEFETPKVVPDFSKLQENFDSEATLDDVGFVKEAANAGYQNTHQLAGSGWAGVPQINEAVEIQRHIHALLEEKDLKMSYVEMELYLKNLGYGTIEIRKAFKQATGIDPDRSYLDFANCEVPPDAVPRFNYAWGRDKHKEGVYYFVLPYIQKFCVFKQEGLDRSIVSEHDLVHEAQVELKKHVKETQHVTPSNSDVLSDIVQKVAKLKNLSENGASIYKKAKELFKQDPNFVASFVSQAYDDGKLTGDDLKIIAANIVLAAPENPNSESGSERVDDKEFNDFRQEQEGRSFTEIKRNVDIPGDALTNNWQASHKTDLWGMLSESHKLFTELQSTINGYRLEPSWATFSVMESPALVLGEDDEILSGSIAVGTNIEKLGTNEETQGLLLLFIQNGKIRYAGQIRGINNRDYSFSDIGLDEMFNDLEGSTSIDNKSLPAGSDGNLGGSRPGNY